jgi:hypothetical protein
MCFVVNLYFIKGALAAYDPNRQLFGVLEMAASLALFCSALLYVRWRYQLNRKLAGEGESLSPDEAIAGLPRSIDSVSMIDGVRQHHRNLTHRPPATAHATG